jgi:hypothetical protein
LTERMYTFYLKDGHIVLIDHVWSIDTSENDGFVKVYSENKTVLAVIPVDSLSIAFQNNIAIKK